MDTRGTCCQLYVTVRCEHGWQLMSRYDTIR